MKGVSAVVIIPTYNERDNIAKLVRALLMHDGVGVMVVDDASPDGTGVVVDELVREFPERVDVLHRTSQSRLRTILRRRHQARPDDAGGVHLPDGCGFLARPWCRPFARRRSPERGRRDRFPIRARRWRSQLAAAPPHTEPICKPIRAHDYPIRRARLHQWLPLLAARGACGAAASIGSSRTATPSSSKCSMSQRNEAAASSEVPITFVERREGQSKMSLQRHRRIGCDAVATDRDEGFLARFRAMV